MPRFDEALSTRTLAAAIVLVALAQVAWAEGGLPGGLRTATESSSAVSAAQIDTADASQAPESGGALFIPFADTADLRARHIESLDQRAKDGNHSDRESDKGNGYVVASIAAAIGLVVLTWVVARVL